MFPRCLELIHKFHNLPKVCEYYNSANESVINSNTCNFKRIQQLEMENMELKKKLESINLQKDSNSEKDDVDVSAGAVAASASGGGGGDGGDGGSGGDSKEK